MKFTQYLVIGASIQINPGQFVKDLDEDQLKRRRSFLKEVKKGIYECVNPFEFKSGEVVWLDPNSVKKSDLKVMFEPGEIDLPEIGKESIFDDMTKRQIIAWAEKNSKDLDLDMRMTRDDMLAIVKGQKKPEESESDEPKEDGSKGKAPI